MTSSETFKLIVAGGAVACAVAFMISSAVSTAVAPLTAPLEQPSTLADLERQVDTPIVTAGSSLSAHERAALGAPPAPARPAPAHGAEVVTPVPILGRVIDTLGAAVPGIEVRRKGPSMPRGSAHAGFGGDAPDSVTTDARGEFVYPGSPPVQLTVGSSLYIAVFEAWLRERPVDGAHVTIVAARRIPVGGVVVDEYGNGIEGANVRLEYSASADTLPRELVELQGPVRHFTDTDARGQFQFSTAGDMAGTILAVNAAGYSDARVPVPEGGDATLRIPMSRAVPGRYVLVGHVQYAEGGPAVDALVSTGSLAVATDASGRFLLDHEPAKAWIDHTVPLRLVAVSPGRLPATHELPSLSTILVTGCPEDLVLVLAGAPLAIRGRVLDSDGAPMSNIEVVVLDSTPFGSVRLPDSRYSSPRSVEDIAGGGMVITNRQGEFELRGLLDRDYRLEALERARVLTVVSEPIRAGTRDVQLVLDTKRVGRLRGRVVDNAGLGVAGVRVSVSVERPTDLVIGPGALTDTEGRFTISGVTTNPPLLRLEGEPIVPQLFAKLPPDADLEDFELRVARRCRIQFEWADWLGRADTLQLVDASGVPLPGMVLDGGFSPRDDLIVEGARSAVWTVSEEARFAVLLLAGKEVTRFPVQPARDGVARVQL